MAVVGCLQFDILYHTHCLAATINNCYYSDETFVPVINVFSAVLCNCDKRSVTDSTARLEKT